MGTNNHEDENRKSFWKNNWQWVVSMILFVVFAGFMIYNTWPQKHPKTQELLNGLKQQIPIIIGEKTVEQQTTAKNVPVYDAWGRVVTAKETSSTTKKINLPESYVISKENMDKALTAVAYAARAEAHNEYKENFSILLTILTVFGIAWPVIIQMLQFKFNEKELEKIEIAKKQADDSLQTATSAVKNALDSIKVLLIQYRVFSQIYYDMGQDRKQTNPGSFGIFNHYFALSLEFKLRSFTLDKRNVAVGSITHILKEFDFSQPNSDDNISCRNVLTTCKAIAGEIKRNAIGTVREKEAEKVWLAVVKKYNQFGGSPIDGEDD